MFTYSRERNTIRIRQGNCMVRQGLMSALIPLAIPKTSFPLGQFSKNIHDPSVNRLTLFPRRGKV
jgi:hypothetical protein